MGIILVIINGTPRKAYIEWHTTLEWYV